MSSKMVIPEWEGIESVVEEVLLEAIQDLEENSRLSDLLLSKSLVKQIEGVQADVLKILGERGRAYGEDVLFLLGDTGFVAWTVSKALRLLWAYRKGLNGPTRDDDWMDLIGYGILRMAVRRLERRLQNNGTEDDEGCKK